MWSLYNKFFQRRGWHLSQACRLHTTYICGTCPSTPLPGCNCTADQGVCECDGGQGQAWDKNLHEFPFIDLRPCALTAFSRRGVEGRQQWGGGFGIFLEVREWDLSLCSHTQRH